MKESISYITCVLLLLIYIQLIIRFVQAQLQKPDFSPFFLLLFFLYHIAFLILYILLMRDDLADFKKYITVAESSEHSLVLTSGTTFIYLFTRLFTSVGFSLHLTSLVYSIFGYIGLILIISSIKQHLQIKREEPVYFLLLAILFFPGLNLWSVAIGKDSLFIFSIGLILYGLVSIKQRFTFLIMGLISTFLIRTHIGSLIICSLSIAYTLSSTMHMKTKIFIFMSIALGSIFMFMIIAELTPNDVFSLSQIYNQLNISLARTIEVNQNSNAGYDVLKYGHVSRILIYLYGPLFYDIKSVLYLFASFENLILIVMTAFILRPSFLKHIFQQNDLFTQFLIIYFIFGVGLLSQFNSNYGIAMRQKIMFFPCLIFLFIYSVKLLIKSYKLKNTSKLKKEKN